MAKKIGSWSLVAALGLFASSCMPDDACPTMACPHDVRIELSPPITAAGDYAVSVEVDGAKLDCWVAVPLDGKAACTAGGDLGVRDIDFSSADPDGGDLGRITIRRQPEALRLLIAREETSIVDETLKSMYGDEQLGKLTCGGEPYMCRVGRATVSTR